METAIQKTAERLLKNFERHEPEPVHNCPTCNKEHNAGAYSKPWHSFTLEAIQSKSEDYEAVSTLIRDSAPDGDAGYEWTASVLEAIKDGEITNEDNISEWADSSTPVYTWDLLQWFAKSTNRLDLISDMQSEYGTDPDCVGGSMLMRAYCFGLDRFARAVWYVVERLSVGKEEQE